MFRDTDEPFDLDHDGRLNVAEEAYKYDFNDHYLNSARGDQSIDDVGVAISEKYSFEPFSGKKNPIESEEPEKPYVWSGFGESYIDKANDIQRSFDVDWDELRLMEPEEREKILEEKGYDRDLYNEKVLDTIDQLKMEGLETIDLELMSPEERYQAIEDAGLDPGDFDIDDF